MQIKTLISVLRKEGRNGKNKEKFWGRGGLEVRWPWSLSPALKLSAENGSSPHAAAGCDNAHGLKRTPGGRHA